MGDVCLSMIFKRATLFVRSFTRSHIGTKFKIVTGLTILIPLLVFALFSEYVAPFPPLLIVPEEMLDPPSMKHFFGTDRLGRDVLSRCMYGSRASIAVAILSTLISLLIGVLPGICSGYFGGSFDRVLVMVMDALYCFPTLILGIAVSAMLGPGILNTAGAVALGGIAGYFRTTRSLTMSIREKTFIEAEKALGASSRRVILRHILPECLPSIFVLTSYGIGRAVLSIASLGFLGLGVSPPIPEWGTDLSFGRMVLLSGAWWTTVFPGIFILFCVLGFNMISEGLTNMLSPRVKA